MSDDQLVNAERDFQRRLTALHAARAKLAEQEAALHRLAIHRMRMEPGEAAAQEAVLSAQRAKLTDEVDRLHAAALAAQAALRRLTDLHIEPDVISPQSPVDGFEQPPFREPW